MTVARRGAPPVPKGTLPGRTVGPDRLLDHGPPWSWIGKADEFAAGFATLQPNGKVES